MTVTLELTPQLEAQVRECLARGDAAAMRDLLAAALILPVEAMLLAPPPPLTDEEFEAVLDEMDAIMDEARGPNAEPLSDYAVSREGLYEGRP